jgi:quaternary ammonium compound-resistance protein SugE
MNWIQLFLAGIFEIGWTIGLKQMDDHKNLTWTAIFYVSIYTSIGAIGTVLVGMIFFKEPINALRIFFLVLIIFGVLGLKFTSNH